jgi:serine/threonine-protein kinase
LGIIFLAALGSNYFRTNSPIVNTPAASTVTVTEPASTKLPTATDTPVPSTFTPAPDVGSTLVSEKDGMTLMYVPEGKFLMGSDDSDSDELPLHSVGLDAFWIDRTEVITDMYMLCVQAGACKKPNDVSHYVNPKYYNHPVVYVTWEDAAAYCSWAGRRLPTEAEWEKAARGTNGSIYPWGDQSPDKTLLNFNNNIKNTTRAGKYPDGASVYGALDMAGNAWEWVNDWYGEIYYRRAPSSNPLGPETGTSRVLRGGMWASDGYFVHSSDRAKAGATFANFYIGFRCAQTP